MSWGIPKNLKNKWFSFTTNEKTIELMLQLYLLQNNFNHSQALSGFRRDNDYFLNIWNKDYCNRIMKVWWKIPDETRRHQVKMGLVYLAIKIYLDKNINHPSFQTDLNYGLSLIQTERPASFTPEFLEILRIYKLKENLEEWVNLKKITYLKNQPLNLLKMIILYNEHVFPDKNFFANSKVDINLFPWESIRSFDEAAVLWDLLNNAQRLNSTNSIRETYFTPLALDYKKQSVIDQIILLFETPISFDNGDIYFDGFAFKNAKNKTFYDLIKPLEKKEIFSSFNSLKKTIYLEEALEQMGESVHYPIGSLHHSVDSCLMRIFQYQYHYKLHSSTDPQLLMGQFFYREQRWKKRKDYPINPRILLALHLAKSNGVSINGTTWQERTQFILTYLDEKFKEEFISEEFSESPLYFNRRKTTFLILKKLGFSDEEINRKRSYILETHVQVGDAVDEFIQISDLNKVRANAPNVDYVFSILGIPIKKIYSKPKPQPLLFTYHNKSINPMLELDKAESIFRNGVYNPWVREEAKENLEHRRIEITEKNIQLEINRLIENHQNQVKNKTTSTVNSHDSLIYSIPVIGSIKYIVEGIKNKNAIKLLLGSISFSLDALAWLIPLRNKMRSLYYEVMPSLLSKGEKVAAVSLNFLKNELKLPQLIESNILIKESSYFNIDSTEVPEGYESVIAAVRQGARDKVWQDAQGKEYPLIYLSDTDEVVPVKPQGGYYRQVDWSGRELRTRPLIYRDVNTEKYTMAALRGGSGEIASVSLTIEEFSYTVREVKILLKIIKDCNIRENFLREFEKYFSVVKGSQKFDIVNFFKDAYHKSPILRGFFNSFFDSFKSRKIEHYKIFIKKSLRGGSYYRFRNNEIVIDNTPLRDIYSYNHYFYQNANPLQGYVYHTDYLSSISHNAVIIQINSISRILNVLTGRRGLFLAWKEVRERLAEEMKIDLKIFDLSEEEIATRASSDLKLLFFLEKANDEFDEISKKEQGAIAWLTDRIMLEISKDFLYPTRLSYQIFANRPFWVDEVLISRVTSITDYLENELSHQLQIDGSMSEFIFGEQIAQRKMVQELKILFEKISSISLSQKSFSETFSKHFIADEFSKQFFEKLYKKSLIFQKIFDTYANSVRILFSFPVELAEIKITDPALFPEIDSKRDSVHSFIKGETHYLSKQGVIPFEKERWDLFIVLGKLFGKNAFELTELATRAIKEKNLVLSKKLIAQRNEPIYVTDLIFKEANINYPNCISGVFVTSDNPILRKQLISNRAQLYRIAFIENQYIAKKIICQSGLSSSIPGNCYAEGSYSLINQALMVNEPSYIQRKTTQTITESAKNNEAKLSLSWTIIGSLISTLAGISSLSAYLFIKRFRRPLNTEKTIATTTIPLLLIHHSQSTQAHDTTPFLLMALREVPNQVDALRSEEKREFLYADQIVPKVAEQLNISLGQTGLGLYSFALFVSSILGKKEMRERFYNTKSRFSFYSSREDKFKSILMAIERQKRMYDNKVV